MGCDARRATTEERWREVDVKRIGWEMPEARSMLTIMLDWSIISAELPLQKERRKKTGMRC